jgi:hypothetical protein
MSEGEVIRESHLAIRLRFQQKKVVLGGEIQEVLMFKLQKNGRPVRNSLTMSKRILQRTRMYSHQSTRLT